MESKIKFDSDYILDHLFFNRDDYKKLYTEQEQLIENASQLLEELDKINKLKEEDYKKHLETLQINATCEVYDPDDQKFHEGGKILGIAKDNSYVKVSMPTDSGNPWRVHPSWVKNIVPPVKKEKEVKTGEKKTPGRPKKEAKAETKKVEPVKWEAESPEKVEEVNKILETSEAAPVTTEETAK